MTALIIALAVVGIACIVAIPMALLSARAIRISHPPGSLSAPPPPAADAEGGAHPAAAARSAPASAAIGPRRDAPQPPQAQRWRAALEKIAHTRCQTPYSGGSCVGRDEFYWCHPCIARLALDPRYGCTPIDTLAAARPLARDEGYEARPGENFCGDPPSVSQGVPIYSQETEAPSPQPDPLRREVPTHSGASRNGDDDAPGCANVP